MGRYIYPLNLEPDDNATLLVTSDDFPELTTFGEDEHDALTHAADALAVMAAQYMRRGLSIPSGSPARGRPTVTLPALIALKVSLYEAMRKAGVSRSELARMLEIDPRQVRRMLDPLTSSRVEELERALGALGKRLEIRVSDAA
jgi:antitoxin HicB